MAEGGSGVPFAQDDACYVREWATSRAELHKLKPEVTRAQSMLQLICQEVRLLLRAGSLTGLWLARGPGARARPSRVVEIIIMDGPRQKNPFAPVTALISSEALSSASLGGDKCRLEMKLPPFAKWTREYSKVCHQISPARKRASFWYSLRQISATCVVLLHLVFVSGCTTLTAGESATSFVLSF